MKDRVVEVVDQVEAESHVNDRCRSGNSHEPSRKSPAQQQQQRLDESRGTDGDGNNPQFNISGDRFVLYSKSVSFS